MFKFLRKTKPATPTENVPDRRVIDIECLCCGSREIIVDVDDSPAYVHTA